jgi:hypothetical protein
MASRTRQVLPVFVYDENLNRFGVIHGASEWQRF